ncbi:hypothetical protein PC129_g17053 [Phytophthora cactorum]|nr:hypothetical protein PC112_g19289 [Phytophthora cactorum]KAG2804951.1 hypothetical protein PC111_g18040 [Phytophthora cactorum]KAG2842437.1 hypothetical protein PC113_g18802 [Phytophthora cactorum]KAG2893945.1 hypothetical protein PC115_g18297 [Phytophthora cactorum]KAG2985378.1 hypothetical protein PC119_g20160 [Phytophthora cactorum]
MDQNTLRTMAWTPASFDFDPDARAFPSMRDQAARPSTDTRAKKDPVKVAVLLYADVPVEIHHARDEQIQEANVDQKARQEHARLTREGCLAPGQTLRDFRRRLRVELDYVPREVLCVMGLLVAHMLHPTRTFSDHWAMTDDGGLCAGNFGQFMSRNRCTAILRDLYFCNNDTTNKRDKLWKLRAIVDVLLERFLAAWTVPNVSLLMKVYFQRRPIATVGVCLCRTSHTATDQDVHDVRRSIGLLSQV